MAYTYDFYRPALTVDGVLWALPPEGPLRVLLIRRRNPPFQGQWALPGGFVDEGEAPETAIGREMAEETGSPDLKWECFGVFGEPGRDPRGHTISMAFLAVVRAGQLTLRAADDARDLDWFSLDQLPPLAFDHEKIVSRARTHLCQKILPDLPEGHPLPDAFTLPQLKEDYERLCPKLQAWSSERFEKYLQSSGRLSPAEDGISLSGEKKLYTFRPVSESGS